MIRNVQDLAAQGTAFPTGLQGAFQEYVNLEGIDATVLDARVGPAPGIAAGTLWVENFEAASLSTATGTPPNYGDAYYIPSGQYGQAVPMFSYGVLVGVPVSPPQGNVPGLGQNPGLATGGQIQQLRIRQKGACFALCTTGGGVAIAPGTLLTADGNGNLTPFAGPSAAPTPTVTPEGATGAATWSYALVAVGSDGAYSAIGTAGSTTTGNATLTVSNYNLITWTSAVDAAQYIIVRTASGGTPSSTGVIGVVNGGVESFADTGLPIDTRTTATQFAPQPATPSAPTVAQVTGATAGAATYGYRVSAILPNGVWSAHSSATALTTGAATLSPTQGNLITWAGVTGAVGYAIERSTAPAGYTTGIIGFSSSPTTGFTDYGQVPIGTYAALQQIVPSPTPTPGTVMAVAKGSLAANTTAPTMVLVTVGGY